MSRPYLKWLGGKSRSLQYLTPLVPEFKTYFEPFLGGGAVFLDLADSERGPISGMLSDTNQNLILTWESVRDDVDKLIEYLNVFEADDSPENFYGLRTEYNKGLSAFGEQALFSAAFIYLNRAGYNGLYRENSDGHFNVPFSKKRSLGRNILLEGEIRVASELLQGVDLACTDYGEVAMYANQNSFVYMDPPYHDTFDKYTKSGFTEADQEELAMCFEALSQNGAKVMLSNSDTPLIRKLYGNYNIIESLRPNSVNSNPEDRKAKPDLIILNYDPE